MTEAMRESAPGDGSSVDLTRRMIDGLFRRLPLYLIPVLLLGAFGVRAALNSGEEYVSEGTLSASANPLVPAQEIRTTELNDFESPAEGTARLINEQLRTDAFLDRVAGIAGLDVLIASDVLKRDIVRQQLLAVEEGQNFLTVQATWDDPNVAFLLVQGTIDSYLAYVEEVVTGDSADAVVILNIQLDDAVSRVTVAQNELDKYVSALPPVVDVERPTEVQLELSRLSSAVERTNTDVSDTERSIEEAKLAAEQAQSAAGRQLRVVDVPNRPAEPESSIVSRAILVAMFTIIGLLASATVLFASTWLDRSLRSRRQLTRVVGGSSVVLVNVFKNQ